MLHFSEYEQTGCVTRDTLGHFLRIQSDRVGNFFFINSLLWAINMSHIFTTLCKFLWQKVMFTKMVTALQPNNPMKVLSYPCNWKERCYYTSISVPHLLFERARKLISERTKKKCFGFFHNGPSTPKKAGLLEILYYAVNKLLRDACFFLNREFEYV